MTARKMTAARKAKLFALDLLFPNRCGCCGTIIRWDALLCDQCADALEENAVCGWDMDDALFFRAEAAYYYADRARDGILELKRGGNGNFAEVIGIALAQRIKTRQTEFTADYIIPVPAKKSTIRERGYNQAALIAKEISRLTGIAVREDCLRRLESSSVQHTLDAKAREENAFGYQSCGKNLDGCRIILCDDVVTTGATARRCAALLQEQGAAAVMLLAGTITKRKEEAHGYRN